LTLGFLNKKFLVESEVFMFAIEGEYGLSFKLSKSAIVIRFGEDT
jgi:hypothetical protein